MWVTETAGSSLSVALQQQTPVEFGPQTGTTPTIDVDPSTVYQGIDGFGAAMTDSAAYLISGSSQRDALMSDLFSSSGIGLSFVRVTMGASDLSLSTYSYDDTCCDLSDFSVSPDVGSKIPLLQQALQLNPEVRFLGTPWSAPGWMKIGGTFVGNCQGSANYLRNADYDLYAQYFSEFIQAYQGTYGLPIFMVSMQNEPHNCNSSYGTMNMEPGDQSTFALSLRSALDNAGLGGVRIMAWDHNWYENNSPTTYPQDVLSYNSSQALGAVQAVGYHCYSSPAPGGQSVQTTFHNAYPSKDVYLTECTGGGWATNAASNFVWEVQNLLILPVRNWARGSLYWSLALDPDGNPHTGGCSNCRGMVTVNSDGSYVKNEDYYAWGHFSKFVAPNAVRIDSTDLGPGSLESAAFRNPDGSIALVVLNSSTSAQAFQVRSSGQGFDYTLSGGSAATFSWTPPDAATSLHSNLWYQVVNVSSGGCVDASGAGTTNGTAIDQAACASGQDDQAWQLVPTDSGYFKVLNRRAALQQEVWDVTGGTSATADGVPIQLWAGVGDTNQQWQPVPLGGGAYQFVARHSGKCLTVPSSGAQLVQSTCTGTTDQAFQLVAQP